MSPFLQLSIALVVIITAAKLGGYLSYRIGQPAVLGELLAGLVLGPSVLDFLHWPLFSAEAHVGETIAELAELGVLLLMFIAGLDLHLSDLARSGRVSALAGMLGMVTPVALGFGAGRLFGLDAETALFLGLILAATSVSISAQTLMELGVLRSRVGISLLGAAVLDDILVVLGLSVFIALFAGSAAEAVGLSGVALILLRMVAFLVVGGGLGFWLVPRLSRQVDRMPISQGLIAFTFVVMLLYGWASEALGSMAAITGAFLAGLIFARSQLKERIQAGMSTLAYGVFVPIFFVNIGLAANARELTGESLLFLAVLVLTAVVSKVLGAGLGARLGGLGNREALQLGVGMMSRGEVGLIVATVGINTGVVGEDIFAEVVGVVILTTLLTPPLLRSLFAERPTQTSVQEEPLGEAS